MDKQMRGIRGATTVKENTSQSILKGTEELLKEILLKNEICIEDICSIFFSVTNDLNMDFPAKAARNIGLDYTPLICMTEIPVPTDLKKCVRVLLHVNSVKIQKEMIHIYQNDAVKLRPDLKK